MLSLRHVCTATVVTFALAFIVQPAFAQGPANKTYTDHRRLGTATSFNGTALTDAASVKRMAAKKGMADDIRKLLRDSGISETSDAVIAALSGATRAVKGTPTRRSSCR